MHDAEAASINVNSKLKFASAAVVQGLSDKDSAAHSQMWECVLIFCRAFPSALTALDLNKAVVPRLLTLVKNGCYGSAVESFPCLVPFAQLCTLPAHASQLTTLAVLLHLIFFFFAWVVSNIVFGLAVTSCRRGEAEMCEYGL